MSKKKILLLSDDLRLPSGIGTISKEIVLKTVHEYDWVQLGAAINHPDKGKTFDISESVKNETGVEDANVKIVPWSGYGDKDILMLLLEQEKPDAIFHFTDPRFWKWLYAVEHDIKTKYKIPLIYYSIWDDLPYPMWNAPYYASSDLIMGISKQSHNIHNEVLSQNGYPVINLDTATEISPDISWDTVYTSYIPHGLDETIYKVLPKDDELYKKVYDVIKVKNNVDFVVFWNNRNIRRKQPGDVILAFKTFRDKLPKSKQDKVALVMHTSPVDGNGTDLRAIHRTIAPECKVIFSENKVTAAEMNALYNVSDVVINIGSNEGWGLSSTEALLSGTVIINNVTGGLQDQLGFTDKNGNYITFNDKVPTNHNKHYTSHGPWAIPIWPSNRSLQGSPETPYIFDDRVDFNEVAHAIREWYNCSQEYRHEMGMKGRQFCLENGLTSRQMADKMIKNINFLFDNPKEPRPKFTVESVEDIKYKNMGVV